MMEISVIVPVYNVQDYLIDCVESILNQSFKHFELILVDDGSADNSGKLCDQFACKDTRVKVYHKANEGLGITRKYGFERSIGKYVTFIDSDDTIIFDYLERLYSTAQKNKADLVVSGYTKTDEYGKVMYSFIPKEEKFKGADVKNVLLPRFIGSLPDRQDSVFTGATGKLYLREALATNHVTFFSEREIQSEDLAFQFEALQYLSSASVIAYSGYKYRTNRSSLSLRYKPERFEEVKKVYIFTRNEIEKLHLPSEANIRADKMLYVQMLSCIKQETPAISKKKIAMCLRRIKEMLKDSLVQNSVRNYPIKKLSFKQKVYVLMIRCKMSTLLYLACKVI